jgi:hypothetical protein
MVHHVDATAVYDAALDLETTGTPVTVPNLAVALERAGVDCAEAQLRASVEDLASRRYLGFVGEWDGDEKIYTII